MKIFRDNEVHNKFSQGVGSNSNWKVLRYFRDLTRIDIRCIIFYILPRLTQIWFQPAELRLTVQVGLHIGFA